MGRRESKYLITQLFAMEYFHYYCNPLDFCVWFLPFKKVEQGIQRTYRVEEWKEKERVIKANQYGIYRNYASQGFIKDIFYEPAVRHGYFYQQLSLYDSWKDKRYSRRENVTTSIEDYGMKAAIEKILKMETLYLKKDVCVPEPIKNSLLADLKIHDNKYVLAELLYYIVSETHQLPDVQAEEWETVEVLDFGIQLPTSNIYMGFRRELDAKKESIQVKIQEAEELQLLFFNGSSLLGTKSEGKNFDLQGFFKEKGRKESKFRLEVILTEPGSCSEREACNWKENFYHRSINKDMLSTVSIETLKNMKKSETNKCKIEAKQTKMFLPYALLIVKYEDMKQDFMKVDLYSPYIIDREERPALYLYRYIHKELFEHFQKVFYHIWNDDDASAFI